MVTNVFKPLKTAFMLLLTLTLLTGFIYPMVVTGIAQLFFPWQANGSFVEKNGVVVGSALIGQFVDSPNYFWGRPSATSPFPYNAAQSSSSNLGPSNPALLATIKERITLLRQLDPQNNALIPIDLVTASGSGLDPDISPLAALYQAPRIAAARHIPILEINDLIAKLTNKRTFYVLGEPRINVLALNTALDTIQQVARKERSVLREAQTKIPSRITLRSIRATTAATKHHATSSPQGAQRNAGLNTALDTIQQVARKERSVLREAQGDQHD